MPSGIPSASDITASSVASIEVGIQSTGASSSQATLKPSVGSGKGGAGDDDQSKSGSSDATHGAVVAPLLGLGSAAVAAMGGAALLA